MNIEAAEILAELDRRGVRTEVRGDRLRCRPADAIPSKLLEQVRAHKSQLLPLVQARCGSGEAGRAAFAGTARPQRSARDCVLMRVPGWDTDWKVRLCNNREHQHQREEETLLYEPAEVEVLWAEVEGLHGQPLPARERNLFLEVKRVFGGDTVPEEACMVSCLLGKYPLRSTQ